MVLTGIFFASATEYPRSQRKIEGWPFFRAISTGCLRTWIKQHEDLSGALHRIQLSRSGPA